MPETNDPLYELFSSDYRGSVTPQQFSTWVAHPEESTGQFIARRSIPFVSPALNFVESRDRGRARQRIASGVESEADRSIIAAETAQQARDSQAGVGSQVVSGLAHIPGMIGEALIGGAALRGAGLAAQGAVAAPSLLTSAGMTAARTGAQTAVMPSMWLDAWGQRAAQASRDPVSAESVLKDLPPAFTLGAVQTAILGRIGSSNLGQRILPGGQGWLPAVGRAAVRTGAGMAEQQGADLIGGALDFILPEVWQLKTHGGILGLAAKGKWGEAMQHAAVQAVTFAAFSVLHPIIHGEEALTPQNAPEVKQGIRDGVERLMDGVTPANVKDVRAAQDVIVETLRQNPATTAEQIQAVVDVQPPKVREQGMSILAEINAGLTKGQKKAIEPVLSEGGIQPTGPVQGTEPPNLEITRRTLDAFALRNLEGELKRRGVNIASIEAKVQQLGDPGRVNRAFGGQGPLDRYARLYARERLLGREAVPLEPEAVPEAQQPPVSAPSSPPEPPKAAEVTPSPAVAPAQAPKEGYPNHQGLVRMYHGGSNDPTSGGGRWVTPNIADAEGWANKSNGKIWYVDVPANHPSMRKSFDDSGINMVSPYGRTEVPENIAKQMKPLAQAPKAASPAVPAPSVGQVRGGAHLTKPGETTYSPKEAVPPAPEVVAKPPHPSESIPLELLHGAATFYEVKVKSGKKDRAPQVIYDEIMQKNGADVFLQALAQLKPDVKAVKDVAATEEVSKSPSETQGLIDSVVQLGIQNGIQHADAAKPGSNPTRAESGPGIGPDTANTGTGRPNDAGAAPVAEPLPPVQGKPDSGNVHGGSGFGGRVDINDQTRIDKATADFFAPQPAETPSLYRGVQHIPDPPAAPLSSVRHRTFKERVEAEEAMKKDYEAEAKLHGIDANSLHQTAKEIMKLDEEAKSEHRRLVLQTLKERPDLKSLAMRHGQKPIDWTKVRDIDVMAKSHLLEYPELFIGHEENAVERLFDLLVNSSPKKMEVGEAYRRALDSLVDFGDLYGTQHPSPEDIAATEKQAEREAQAEIKEEIRASRKGELGKPGEQPGRFASVIPPNDLGGEAKGPLRIIKPKEGSLAVANAETDKLRKSLGMEGSMKQQRQSNAESWDKAMAILEKDPQAGEKLVNQILRDKGGNISVEQQALLEHRNLSLRGELVKVNQELVEGNKANRLTGEQQKLLRERSDQLMEQIQQATQASNYGGSDVARSLAFRRQLIKDDFTFDSLLLRAQAAKGKKPLTDTERAEMKTLSDKVKELTDALAKAEEALTKSGKGHEGDAYEPWMKAKYNLKERQQNFEQRISSWRWENMSKAEQWADWLKQIRVAMLISSPKTAGKVGTSSLLQLPAATLKEVMGSALRMVPGIKTIAEMAPIEGKGFQGDVEKSALSAAGKQGWKDAKDIITKGQTELDVMYGNKNRPWSWLDIFGLFHAAEKAPAVANQYERAKLKIIDAEKAAGRDTTSPAALDRIQQRAYDESIKAKYQEDNALVDAFRSAVNNLKRPDRSVGAQAIGRGLDLLMPIVRTPTNIIAQTLEHVGGLPAGAIKAGIAHYKGLENLTPKEADNIMRLMKRGSLGLPLLALGYYTAGSIGGLYSGKRRPDELKPGEIDTGAGKIPAWMTAHHPALLALHFGATVRRAEMKVKHHQAQGFVTGAMQGLGHLIDEVPFVREQGEIGRLFEEGANQHAINRLAASFVVPALLTWAAQESDRDSRGEVQKRKPDTFIQQLEVGLPGLRQRVPTR